MQCARDKTRQHTPTMCTHTPVHPSHHSPPPQIDPKKDAGKRLASFDGDADRIVYHYFDAEVRGEGRE